MAGVYTSGLLGMGTGTASGTYQSPTTTLGQLLDLYIVHGIFAIVFGAGAGLLMGTYDTIAKPSNAWADIFFAVGALAIAMNAGFFIGALIAWLAKGGSPLSRQDDNIHWLHALSIFSAAIAVFWSILALIITFGTTLVGSSSNSGEVAGYFMVLFSAAYFTYLTVRWMFGLAGKRDAAAPVLQPPTSLDTNAVLAAIAAASANSRSAAASQPLFSGAGAFGGIDLSGLQPSSMSTLPPTQHSSSSTTSTGGGGGGPTVVVVTTPQASPGATSAACAPESNVVHIS